jgi:hypothetical protein|tara:strand:+ start:314 stop:682 length:369 start_codon:yes stop_codon:yes gene_type:complete
MRNTQDHLSDVIRSIKGEVRRTRDLVRDTLTTEQSKEREGQYLNGLRYALDRLNHALEEVRKERNSVCKACDHNILFHAPAPFSIQAQNGGSPWCEGESFKGSKTDCGCKEFILQEEEEVKS